MNARFSTLLLLLLAAVAGGRLAAEEEPPELVGELTRGEIVAAIPDWPVAVSGSEPDPDASRLLASLGAGSEVVIYLGTWCPDSRREVARFWRALDDSGGQPRFDTSYVGVDRSKSLPADRLQGVDLRYVPTFVVRRAGRELGRVVESAPTGIERDLVRLLTGEAEGLLTARVDLVPSVEGENDS